MFRKTDITITSQLETLNKLHKSSCVDDTRQKPHDDSSSATDLCFQYCSLSLLFYTLQSSFQILINIILRTVTKLKCVQWFFPVAINIHPFNGLFSKPIWIIINKRWWVAVVISRTICISFAPRSRQITTPAPHHSIFYRPDALPDTQPTASKYWTTFL